MEKLFLQLIIVFHRSNDGQNRPRLILLRVDLHRAHRRISRKVILANLQKQIREIVVSKSVILIHFNGFRIGFCRRASISGSGVACAQVGIQQTGHSALLNRLLVGCDCGFIQPQACLAQGREQPHRIDFIPGARIHFETLKHLHRSSIFALII